MENKKDIGKAISDKLISLDKSPREQVWHGINEELQKKKKRRTAFFFFWSKVTGVVALGFLALLYFYHQNDGFNFNAPITNNGTTMVNDSNQNTDDANSKEPTKENSVIKNSEINPNNTTAAEDNIKNNTNESKSNNNNSSRTNRSNKTIEFKSNKKGKVYTNSPLNGNAVNSKKGTASTKSGRRGITKTSFSKSSKSARAKGEQIVEKTKLIAKGKLKKSTEKNKSNSQKEKEATNVTKNIDDKSLADLVDLSTLHNKTSNDTTADNKTKKKDSIATKKEKNKDKTDTVFMEPKLKDSTITYHKFYVDVFASPTYYNYFNKESTLDKDLDSLPKKSEIKFSYGVGLTYDLTNRISVRIGYRKINLSYITKNAPIGVNNPNSQYFTGIGYNANISNESIYIASDGSSQMDVTQKISYTEIPIEVKYKFLDKKLSLKSSLGFSYLLLNDNRICIQTLNGFIQQIGKTNDLSKSALSLNIGLEVEYPLFKNFSIFIEPMFNYQVKAFSNSTFKPYVLGVHTGLRFSLNNK